MDSLTALWGMLTKLRRWILGTLAAFLICCLPGYLAADSLIGDLAGLLGGEPLYQLVVGEALWCRLVAAMALSCAVIAPVVVMLALRRFGVRGALGYCGAGALLFWLGVAFGRLVLLPFTVAFLLRAGMGLAAPHFSQLSYTGLCLGLLAAVGGVFLLPLALTILHRIGLVRVEALRRARGRVILGSVIVMAVVTPTTDAITLLVATVPVLLLYEGSILCLSVAERRRRVARADG